MSQPIDLGGLRRLSPVSATWGFDRGLPIDRHYIARFLAEFSDDITGRTLEIGDPLYTRDFGSGVETSDVLDVDETNPRATIVDDIAVGAQLPSEHFDCVIATQTLQLVFDLAAAVRTLHRVLKPGGVVLATMPGITRSSAAEYPDGWYWALTSASALRLFATRFAPERVTVRAFGNVLSATAFLYGLAAEELEAHELDYHDRDYEVTVAVRAAK